MFLYENPSTASPRTTQSKVTSEASDDADDTRSGRQFGWTKQNGFRPLDLMIEAMARAGGKLGNMMARIRVLSSR